MSITRWRHIRDRPKDGSITRHLADYRLPAAVARFSAPFFLAGDDDVALELDPTAALGYGVRGLERMTIHDWPGAEEDLVRATVLAPNSAQLHTHLATFLTGMAWIFLAKSHYQLDDREETLQACRRSLDLLGENPMTLAYVAHILAQVGERGEAEHAMSEFERQRTNRGCHSRYYAAAALCGLGRKEEALDELDRIDAAATDVGWLLGVDPLLDPLREERRFADGLRRIGLSRHLRK